jgi:hypothetical protein
MARPGQASVTRVGLSARRLLPFALAFLTVAGVTVAALAGGSPLRAQVEDPNDTRGLLDVRRVWFEPETDPLRWTVVTFSPWTAELTRERGFVFLYLDTMGDPRFDFYALLLSNGRHLSGSLWRDPKRGPDVRLVGLDVRRDSDLNVAVRIPMGRLDIGGVRSVYRWSVVTTFTGRVCRATCLDRIPDEGTFEQPVGTPTPTTTATPTTTPTPTPTPTPTLSPSVAAPR